MSAVSPQSRALVCPACHQPLPRIDGLSADIAIGRVWLTDGSGAEAHLTASEAKVFGLLLQSPGLLVTRVAVWQELYFGVGEAGEAEPKIIDVLVYKLRKKLGGLGVRINTVWSRGFVLHPKLVSEAEWPT